MKQILIGIILTINSVILHPQVVLTIEGEIIYDSETNISNGYDIPRSQPTILTFRNNSLTYVNSYGYMLQAGDETPGLNNNNLDDAVISGNQFIWNGTDAGSSTHALFTGYNKDVVIKYNYLKNTPNGIQRKSNGMLDEKGVIAYNILMNPKVGIVVKGMNGIKIYNNTLYSEKTMSETSSRGLIEIQTNQDGGLDAASEGTKVFNNIFYTKNRIFNILIYETSGLSGFESDYNVFWCESGEPMFHIGTTTLTFSQWQTLGYDLHSVVLNPNFDNFTDFVPRVRLDYGKDLGASFLSGLASDAEWGTKDPRTTTQNGIWQTGARIQEGSGKKIFIYPNPALDFFYIIIPDLGISYNLMRVYDMHGRQIMINSVNMGTNKIQIPKQFGTGIYSISLEASDKTRQTTKLLIIN